MKWSLFFAFAFAMLFFFSCKKDDFISTPDANVLFSADTLKFDTVFTSTGSTTRVLKIKNDNDQKLLVSSIKLVGGLSSPFQTNIDGTFTTEAYNIEIAANDSIYIYVAVTIDPTTGNLPFIVSDSIEINYNHTSRYVQLEAYGQNALFITNQTINGTQVWNSPLPIVILESLTVRENGSLTLSAGTKMYVRATAPIIIHGTLITNGTKERPVIFRSDRLDEYYRDLPGSWPGIIFMPTSKNNILTFTEIHNSLTAIKISEPSVNSNPKLILRQCTINNAYEKGLHLTKTNVEAVNTLITNCSELIKIEEGGDYNFIHCTVAGVSNQFFFRQIPALNISNYRNEDGQTFTYPLNAVFTNSIVWGYLQDEIALDRDPASGFGITFQNCLYVARTDPAPATILNCISNIDPQFRLIDHQNYEYDFRVDDPLAPGVNNGIITGITIDLDNQNRNVGLPDFGAYEKQ